MTRNGQEMSEDIIGGSNLTGSTNSRKRRHVEEISHGRHLKTSPKRPRNTEWPLKDDLHTNQDEEEKDPLPAARQRKKQGRRSMFKEGSLNDKPSKQPPTNIIGGDQEMENYMKDENRKSLKGKDAAIHVSTDTVKSGGMFRFGKVIVSALNPLNYWQGMWKEKDVEVKEHPLRKEQIEKAYAEMKAQGGSGMKTTVVPPSAERSGNRTVLETEEWRRDSFRDSGISMGESIDSNTKYESNIGPSDTARSVTPSDAGLGRRSFTHLRSPASTNLKKVKSHLQLPSAKKRSTSRGIPSIDSVLASDSGLRRQPSKKDIARVNRLNKRVSDLETKLATARQELEASLADAPPLPGLLPDQHDGRKSFVPGALASLPSERLLGKYTNTMHESIISTIPGEIRGIVSPGEGSQNLGNALPTTTPPKSPTQQTDSWLEISPTSIQKTAGRTPPRPRRSKPRGGKSGDGVTESRSKNTVKVLVSPTPRNSPSQLVDEKVPAVPIISLNVKNLDKQEQMSPNTPTLPPPSPMRTRSRKGKNADAIKDTTLESRTKTRPSSNRSGTSPPPPSLASASKKPNEPLHGLRRKPVPSSSSITGSPLASVNRKNPLTANGNGKRVQDGRVSKRSPKSVAARAVLRDRGVNAQDQERTHGCGDWDVKMGVDLEKPLPNVQREEWDWGEDIF